jgi:putative endonuclease
MPEYTVYMLECANGSFYTGITTDMERRFIEHFSGKGARYTRSNPPIRIMLTETFKTRSAASKREAEIKGWSRKKKLGLAQHQ